MRSGTKDSSCNQIAIKNCGLCYDCRKKTNNFFKLYDFSDILTNIGVEFKLFRGCAGIFTGFWYCFISSNANQHIYSPHSQELFIENVTSIESEQHLKNFTSIESEQHLKNLTDLKNVTSMSSNGFSKVSLLIVLQLFCTFFMIRLIFH